MLMQCTTTHQIMPDQLAQIEQLLADCHANDLNEVPIYPNLLIQYRSSACNVLCYTKNQLVGFLSVYFFYEDGCEIALMVSPSYRRQGIARHLLGQVLPILLDFQMRQLYFSVPMGQHKAWLLGKGFQYQSSEFQMQKVLAKPLKLEIPLQIDLATIKDVPLLCQLDAECFAKQTQQAADRFLRLVHDPNYSIFVAYQDGVPVGKAHLCWETDGARITDVAVFPELQGQGFGRALLVYCINDALKKNKTRLCLDVETKNERALHLYTQLGFESINSYDYWVTSTKNPILYKKCSV